MEDPVLVLGSRGPTAVMQSSRPPRKKHPREQRREHSRYDQDLGAAKNSGRTVRFTLLQETSFTDEDCEVDTQVLQIDKFDIEVVPLGWSAGNSIWLKKSSIMATRIFR